MTLTRLSLVSSPRPFTGATPDVRREAELGEVAEDLDVVQRRIIARKRELALCWSAASPADRLLAVDRLQRAGNITAAQAASLDALQSKVRAAIHAMRLERKRLVDTGAAATGATIRLDADVVRFEADRDRFVGAAKLTEELWRTSEAFVLPAATSKREGPFREMLAFEALLEQRMLHLQGRGAAPFCDRPAATTTTTTTSIAPAPGRQPLHRLFQLVHSPVAAAGC
ncbi:MAG: hypothetical protein Q8O67_21790 [Deltaproteobacteria bacterium]|nr:hypothetical protein [Deltaproteobacteria bacterium]